MPLLVLQGSHDELVNSRFTKKLLDQFPKRANPPDYSEVDAGHNLMDTDSQAWQRLEKDLLEFAESLKSRR